MKTCCRCNKIKPFTDFYKRTANSDGYQGFCKECSKVYYKTWSEQTPERKNRHAEWKKERIKENQQKYLEHMVGKSCVDCGLSDVRVLEFDHVRGKKIDGVMQIIRRGNTWDKVLEEMAKCEIRCANCHRIATAERGNWWINVSVVTG